LSADARDDVGTKGRIAKSPAQCGQAADRSAFVFRQMKSLPRHFGVESSHTIDRQLVGLQIYIQVVALTNRFPLEVQNPRVLAL